MPAELRCYGVDCLHFKKGFFFEKLINFICEFLSQKQQSGQLASASDYAADAEGPGRQCRRPVHQRVQNGGVHPAAVRRPGSSLQGYGFRICEYL